MNRTQGPGEDQGAQRDKRRGRDERQRTAEHEAREHATQTGYRPSVNQARHEPMPASHDDDLRQEAVVRNEEHARDGEQAQPSPRAPSRQAGQRGRG